MGLRDIKRRARRDLHQLMQVPAYYIRTPDSQPLLVHVRIHNRFNEAGDIKGARAYPAEMENVSPKLIFDLTELPVVTRLATVSVDATEAYTIDHLTPVDDEFQTAHVTRIAVANLADLVLPVPPAGTL